MTTKRAERITGLTVKLRFNDATGYNYGLFDADGSTLLQYAENRQPAKALAALVEWNYARVKMQVFTEQRWMCFHCGQYRPLQADHIVPRSKGRCDLRSNLRGVCAADHERRTNGERLAPSARVLGFVRACGWLWTTRSEESGWEKIEVEL